MNGTPVRVASGFRLRSKAAEARLAPMSIRTLAPLAAVLTTAGAVTAHLQERSTFVPACPRPSYSADGNFQPLFCTIDNPAALAYYRRIAPHLEALGADAAPTEVERAAALDRQVDHAT